VFLQDMARDSLSCWMGGGTVDRYDTGDRDKTLSPKSRVVASRKPNEQPRN
jgi:hypothetical protein